MGRAEGVDVMFKTDPCKERCTEDEVENAFVGYG